MKQIITFLFAFFIMMTNANAQTCEIGLSDISPVNNTLSSNTWGAGTQNQIYGVQRTVNKNGNLTKIGVICGGTASNFKGGVYSDNSNNPDELLQMTGISNPTGTTVDTFLVALNDTISVTAGEKFWVCVNFESTHNRNVLNNGMNSQTGYLRFNVGSNYTNSQFPNLDPCPSGPPCSSTQPGQYAFFLVIEDCVDPMPITIANGDASNPTTWLNGNIPTNGDSAIVQHEVNWDLDLETDGDTLAWLLVTDSLHMQSGSSIQTNALVDSLGNNFAELVRITNPTGNVDIAGTGTSIFDDLYVEADSLFFGKTVEAFNLTLENSIVVDPLNLTMQGKENIPSSIYWDSSISTPIFLGDVTIDEVFTINDPPGSSYGTWRIEGNPGLGSTIGDWDASHTSTGYPDADYPGYNFISPTFYDETNSSSNKDVGYIAPTGDGHVVDSNGYFAYYTAGTHETSVSVTIETDSAEFTGTNTPSGTPNSDGWNLFFNKLPSAVDIDEFILSGVEQTVWTYDHILQTYTDYSLTSGLGTNGRTDSLASGQAFWVKTLAGQTGTVTIPPSAMIKTSDVQYRGGGGTMPAIEVKIFEPGVFPDENTEWANAFIIPFENAETEIDEYDVLNWNTNSLEGNMTISTASSDGNFLSQNFIPNNNDPIIIEVWASTSSPNNFHYLQINVPNEFSGWCISAQWTEEWLGSGTEWFSVSNGQIFQVYTPSVLQSEQGHFLNLRLTPSVDFDIEGPENGIVEWLPNQEEVTLSFAASGNYGVIDWFVEEQVVINDSPEMTYTFTDPGIYTIEAFSFNGCDSDGESFVVFIECTPMSLGYISPETTEVIITEETEMFGIEFEVTAENHESITWQFEDGTIVSGSTTVLHEFTTFGTQNVLVTIQNDCSTAELSFTVIFEEIIGVEETQTNDFVIFPNPSDGQGISIQTKDVGTGTVEVYNSIGSLIQQERVSSGETKELYFTQTLPSGVYFVRLNSPQGVTTKQFVVK